MTVQILKGLAGDGVRLEGTVKITGGGKLVVKISDTAKITDTNNFRFPGIR